MSLTSIRAAQSADAAGLILAGGRSTRFGAEKAAALLAGRAMMLHVADKMTRLRAVAVSARPGSWAERHAPTIGADIVHDDTAGPSGPLAGVLAGLDWASARGFAFLATAPCDAPMLPKRVFDVLLEATAESPAAFAATAAGDHPLCAVWRVTISNELRAALAAGHPSVRGFLQRVSAVRVMFDDPLAFANANTPADLDRLELE